MGGLQPWLCVLGQDTRSRSTAPFPMEGGPWPPWRPGHPGTPLEAGRSAHTSGINSVFQNRTRLIPTQEECAAQMSQGRTSRLCPHLAGGQAGLGGTQGNLDSHGSPGPQFLLCEGASAGPLCCRAVGVTPRARPRHPGSSCCPLPRRLPQGLPEGWHGGHLQLPAPCVPPAGLRACTISPVRELLELPWDEGQSRRGPVGSGRVASGVGWAPSQPLNKHLSPCSSPATHGRWGKNVDPRTQLEFNTHSQESRVTRPFYDSRKNTLHALL